jgi:hypothetical protein
MGEGVWGGALVRGGGCEGGTLVRRGGASVSVGNK